MFLALGGGAAFGAGRVPYPHRYWCETPGNVYFQALKEGRVLYEAA
jgi:hypothetical protein